MNAIKQQELAQRIVAIKNEKGLSYQQLVPVLNEQGILTLQNRPWKFQNLAGFIQKYGKQQADVGTKGQAMKAITKKARSSSTKRGSVRASSTTRRGTGVASTASTAARTMAPSEIAQFSTGLANDWRTQLRYLVNSPMADAEALSIAQFVVTHV